MPVTFSETSTATFPQPAAGGRMTMIDADGDGDMDILYQTGANGTAFQYARSNGDGTYTLVALASSPFAGLTIPDHNGANFHVGDIDGDGDMDLWAGQTTGAGTGSFFRNDGGAFTGQSTATFPQPGASSRVVMGDFDNDGDADMLYQTVGNGTAFQYAESNGDGTYTLLAQGSSPFAGLTLPDNGGGTYYAGDFDGDGDTDLWAAVASTTGSFFRNDGGSFSSQSSASFPAPAAATRVAVGDFDSDGDDDILYQTAGDGSAWQYARSNGDGSFTILSQAASPFAGVTLLNHNGSNSLVGDADGDGDDDLIITTNGSQGEFYLANGKPPEISTSTPSDNGTGVAPGATITLTFDESVSKGSGNIYIYRGDGVLIETISVGSAQVSGAGATWTIDPSVTLAGLTNYYVLIDDGTWVDGDGSIFFGIDDPTTLNFTTAAANTAPTFTNLDGDTPAFTEGTAVRLDVGDDATVADAEQANFNGGTLTVSISANEVAGQDVLSVANIGLGAGQISVSGSNVSYQGVVIGSFTGGTGGADLVITLDADATPAATQALVRALRYNNTSQAPDPAARTITITLTDGAGGTSTVNTVTVGVTPVNDAPTVVGGTVVTLSAENEDVVNPAGATVSALFGSRFNDVDGDALAGVMIGINNSNDSQGHWQVFTGGAWSDLPSLSPVDTYLVSASDSLRFVPAANYNGAPGTLVVLLIDDSAGPVTTGTRLDSSLTGSGGSTVYTNSTMTLGTTINAVADAAVAVNDAGSVAEAGTTSGSVFGNDSDVDGPALEVAEVNGSAAAVGVPTVLPSGALLTLNADGTYFYDTNGSFEHVPAPGSGGIPVTDSFTYTLVGGGTATVTISITGSDNEDWVLGDAGDNVLDGGDGDDTVLGGGGDDTLIGGPGTDTADYSGASGGTTVRLNTGVASPDGDGGVDTLSGFENVVGSDFNDTLVGSAGGNTLTGGLGADFLIGLGGDDILIGGSGAANQMQGGAGNDDYFVSANDTIVENPGEGYDRVFTIQTRLVLAANVEELNFVGPGASTGIGNATDNAISGGDGDDTLWGAGGDDILDGGDGLDTADYSLAASGVTVFIDSGTAQSDGDGGVDTLVSIENLRGSVFDDTLYGAADANVLDGGLGNDVLVGRGGNDTLRGGDGFDTADYSDATSGVLVKLNIGRANDGEGGLDTLVSIEDVQGSLHNDVLIGNGESNFLYGGDGSDVLIGLDGDDYLEGGEGAPNQLQGGLGDDRYLVEANDTLVEFEDEGFDSVATSLNNYTLRANFEELAYIGSGNFVGTGNALDNFIYGGDGDDILTGGQGDDVLAGSSGCGCGGGGVDTAVLSGVLADYIIEDLGGGVWGVTDTVAGRDGFDFLVEIDQLRFSDGTVFALVSSEDAPAADAKALDEPLILPGVDEADGRSAKDGELPLVLPGVTDDDFLFGKDGDWPQVLPGDEGGALLSLGELSDIIGSFPALSLQADLVGADILRGQDHDDWMFST